MNKIESIIEQNLSKGGGIDKILSLNILYLKYIKVLEEGGFENEKYFCYEYFNEEIEKLNDYFKIEILENPFRPIVIDELKNEYLIDFPTIDRIEGIRISADGIYHLKKTYGIDSEPSKNIITYNTIIINTINNITNGISKEEDKKSFFKKVSNFLEKVGVEIASNPDNIIKFLQNINAN